jgi:(p)ppGpp synthase/HD superfamily hydrolase
MFSDKIEKAIRLASLAHHGQFRKDGKTPYVSHCFSVGYILKEYDFSDDVVIAGILHDTLEDTSLEGEIIKKEFGENVYNLVIVLTDKDVFSEIERRQSQIEKFRTASDEIKAIKAADILHNVYSFLVYLEEGVDIWKEFGISRDEQIKWYEKRVESLENGWDHPMTKIIRKYIERL